MNNLGLVIRDDIKNIKQENMIKLENEMGNVIAVKEKILNCILNSKLEDFKSYEDGGDWGLLSNYYGFYNLELPKKEELVSKCLKECIEEYE